MFERALADMSTGEVHRQRVQVRCGSRRVAECHGCARLYAGDVLAVIRSGLFGADARQRPATWVTLTAPGAATFGQTHSQLKVGDKVRRCPCGEYHNDSDALLGTPVDAAAFDYAAAADFNARAGRLATVTFQKLGRIMSGRPDVARVVEYQVRGLVHIHALVRGVVTEDMLRLVVQGGVNPRTGRRIAPASHGGWSWGTQCKAQLVTAGHGARLGAYMSKLVGYAAKSAGESLPAHSKHAQTMADVAEAVCCCSSSIHECRSGRTTFEGPAGKVRYHGKPASATCRRHKSARRGWGYRGHIFATSRSWGVTFTALRARRRAWAAAATPEATGQVVSWRRIADTSDAVPLRT